MVLWEYIFVVLDCLLNCELWGFSCDKDGNLVKNLVMGENLYVYICGLNNAGVVK